MAKPKSPLLSLGAHGTIGDALTYQKRGTSHIVRQKPIPKDPYSLNQAYQRWDYRDYAYLWTLLTDSEKQLYRTKASKYHITGFSQWMREHLKTLPNLVGRWHLDHISNNQTPDSSKNDNHGTVYGATIVDGIIHKALLFDGLDDYVSIGNIGKPLSWTILAFIKPTGALADGCIAFNQLVDYSEWGIRIHGGVFKATITHQTNTQFQNAASTISAAELPADTYSHITATVDGSFIRFYLNGLLHDTVAQTVQMEGTDNLFSLARYGNAPSNYWKGTIDHVHIHDRVLDATEIKRHSERRYPA